MKEVVLFNGDFTDPDLLEVTVSSVKVICEKKKKVNFDANYKSVQKPSKKATMAELLVRKEDFILNQIPPKKLSEVRSLPRFTRLPILHLSTDMSAYSMSYDKNQSSQIQSLQSGILKKSLNFKNDEDSKKPSDIDLFSNSV
jgi:hypothetical protein